MTFRAIQGIAATFALSMVLASSAQAGPKPVALSLLHTNDLHSHFRGEKTPLGLGGLARIKTAVDGLRASAASAGAHSLLVDGGDWSEGNIYYNEGMGRETVRMMDHIGYDVVVVGNHDWINGPDNLLDVLTRENPSFQAVAANIKTQDYARDEELKRLIPPYVIRQVGDARVAFIGLLTYEFIFDKFFRPVKVTEPFASTRELARALKKQVDAVVVISHNSIKTNQNVLKAAPDVDLIVGAHDHVKLTKPVVVGRAGAKPGWIVETQAWGRYLGQVEMVITPRGALGEGSRPSVELKTYRLHQMDRTVAENPETLSRIATLEARIEAKRGPIFRDHVGDSELELVDHGLESPLGDFATDAYLGAVKADLAMDHSLFSYGSLHEGPQTTVDLFNAHPAVYDETTDKAWTVKILPLKGRTLSWLMTLIYGAMKPNPSGGVNFSGAELIYSPLGGPKAPEALGLGGLTSAMPMAPVASMAQDPEAARDRGVIQSFKIRGQDLRPDHVYRIAASTGIIESIEFLNGLIPGGIDLDKAEDTGLEGWRLMADHLRAVSPLTIDKLNYGGRVRTIGPDVGLLPSDIQWTPRGRATSGALQADVTVRVRNSGILPSPPGLRVTLYSNANGSNTAVDPDLREMGESQPLPLLQPGESVVLRWGPLTVPVDLGVASITARVSPAIGVMAEVNRTNDEATHLLRAE